jgi:hypothetical protein
MSNHPNRSRKSPQKLPGDVYYTRRNGGMYVRWNGRPEGLVSYTYERDRAYGRNNDLAWDGWTMTPFRGADGLCHTSRIIAMAANYGR